MLDEVECFKLE